MIEIHVCLLLTQPPPYKTVRCFSSHISLNSSALVIVWIFIDRNRSIALPLSASPCSGVGGKSFSALQRFVSFVGQTLRIKQKSASESTINTKVRAVGKVSTAIPSNSSHGHHANTSGLVSAEGSQCHTAATGNLSPPPTNMLLPSMYYLLCSAVSDGFITTFVACISTKLAATPMYPIHSRSACRTLSMSAGLVFTLFHLLEKIVTQRVSITLMGSAIERTEGVERNEEHREKEKQREKEKEKEITSSGGSGVSQGNNMMSPNFSALFPTYTLFLAKFMFKRDVGCVSLSNSPLVSLILITVTVVLMLQAILISIFDARRVSHTCFIISFLIFSSNFYDHY